MTDTYPTISGVVLDTTDARALAEFYRALFGLEYREGDAPPAAGEPDPRGEDWLVLRGEGFSLGFQQVDDLARSTWPAPDVPQQLHLDTTVGSADELARQRDRALALGATVLHDRSDHPDEPLYVFADPDGHPFCIFVA
ncbi:VOC family protein [Luteimicrobium subarcticum]|uniref:Glyoxalase/bleomycin resistance protein/dioxygenase superfamily protein n=1 Tax=Luteimicrobium subarcticum TaxID=620910 RepID=A0A2M8WRW8_9MICO|nr:VOC family protein [Luteimicrobium subarcticum]PJI93624.1 glyoxalase/bleomycin resistance protein/dioxygenase superfamily protein [Luteimicrobium subarcticum]